MNFSKIIDFFIFSCVFLLASCTQDTSAASFDCSKASSQVEKIICSDSEISKLDTVVGNIFNSSKKENSLLISEQKKWLKETRDFCKTSECLKNVYSDRIIFLQKIHYCQVKESEIVGSWSRIKGESFEEMNFSILNDIYSFTSWLHHKPEMTGTWKINNCIIYINNIDNEKLNFELKVKKFKIPYLHIMDIETNTTSSYKKIIPPQ